MTRGTVVLTPFPFTDLSGRKVRPAVVVSRSDRSGSDVVLAFITTYHDGNLTNADLLIRRDDPDFQLTGLKVDSVVKCDKLVTIDSSVLLGELGTLSDTLLRKIDSGLKYALGL